MGDTPDLTLLDGIFKSKKEEDVKLREIAEFINKYIAECGMTEAQKAASQERKDDEVAAFHMKQARDKKMQKEEDEGKSGDDLEEMLANLINLLTGILSTKGGGRKQRGGSVLKAKPIDELMKREGETIEDELSKELAKLKPKEGRDNLSETLNGFIKDGVLFKFKQIEAESIGFTGDDEIEMYTSDSEAAKEKRTSGLKEIPKHDATKIQEKILASTKLEPVLKALKKSKLVDEIYVEGYKDTLTSILEIANEKLKVLSKKIYKIAVGAVSSSSGASGAVDNVDTDNRSPDRGESKRRDGDSRGDGGSSGAGESKVIPAVEVEAHHGNGETRDDEQIRSEIQKLTTQTSTQGIDIVANTLTGVETDYQILEENIQKNAGKTVFKFFERAKRLLNSKLLLLLGVAQLEKNGFLTLEVENNINHIPKLFEAFFIILTEEENKMLKDLMLDGKSDTISKQLYDIFVKRDSKILSGNTGGKIGISIYAVLYLLNLNRDISIRTDIPLKPQLFANKPIFGKTLMSDRLTGKNLGIFLKLLQRIAIKLGEIQAIYDIYVTNSKNTKTTTSQDYQSALIKYHKVISDNKRIIALLKRRDDWNNSERSDVGKFHYRFQLTQSSSPEVKGDSQSVPLELVYNDTPLRLPYNKSGKSVELMKKSYTHEYKLYGFDSIFSSRESNQSIADTFNSKYLKLMKEEAKASLKARQEEAKVNSQEEEADKRAPRVSGKLEPLCFIGYGQSGSGKTSALIYLDIKDAEQDGILIEIIKKLNPKYVTTSMIEIYEDESAKKSDDSCIGIGTDKYQAKNESGEMEERPGAIIDCPKKNRKPISLKDPVDIHSNGVAPSLRYVEIGEILDKRADDENKEREKMGVEKQKAFVSPEDQEEREGGGEQKMQKTDNDISVTFERNESGTAWLYTHNPTESGKEGIDKNYDVKQYIMDAFECREIGPTSNNKQSSRSHVVVCLKLQGILIDKISYDQTIYVCDLAGVENEFNCTPGSEDSIRMMAKILANDKYHLNKTKKYGEEWGETLTKKRPGNILKYVHEGIHIGANDPDVKGYDTDPNCWPDSSPNPKGDLDAIAAEYSRNFISDWYESLTGTGNKWDNHDATSAFNYYFEKLKVLPVVESSIQNVKAGIEAFFEAAEQPMPGFRGNTTISQFFFNSGASIYGDINRTITTGAFNKLNGSGINSQKVDSALDKLLPFPTLHTVTVVDSAMKNYNKDTLNVINGVLNRGEQQANWSNPVIGKREVSLSTFGTSETMGGAPANFSKKWVAANPDEIFGVIKAFLQKAFNIFNVLEAPDCVLAYVDGIKSACEIRRQEGYVINNTLKQLIIDLGIVMKESIKEKLEKGGEGIPCVFADMYDEYSEYWVLDPLMDWYDIRNENERNKDFGSILTAMCILGIDKENPNDITKTDKLEFLKQFKFAMTTVINESFMMRRGDKPATTPAGNLIYVNNPPLPPFINVSILELALKKYQFFKFDNRDADDDPACQNSSDGVSKLSSHCDTTEEEKIRKDAVTGFFNAYFNLIIKLFTHPLYQTEAIKQLLVFTKFQTEEEGIKKYPLIQFAERKDIGKDGSKMAASVGDIDALYNAWHFHYKNQAPQLEALENECEALILKIKSNNAATYLGTMQTTEEVNRVSSKIMLSKPVNIEKTLNVLDIENDSKESINNKILQKLIDILTYDGEMPGPFSDERNEMKKRDGQLYECLYQIASLDAVNRMPKRTLTLKEKDVESILVAIEAVFPKAINYVDYKKLQHLWVKATTRADKLGRDIFVSKRKGEQGMDKGYPYVQDIMASKSVSDTDLEEIFKANNKDKTGVLSKTDVHDILTLNAKIKEFGALEPSPSFMGQKEIDAINTLSREKNVLKWKGKGGGKMNMSGGVKKPTLKGFVKYIVKNKKCRSACEQPLRRFKRFPTEDWKTIQIREDLMKKAKEAVRTHVESGGCPSWNAMMERWEKAKAEKDAASAAEAAEAKRYAEEGAQLNLDWYRENSKVTRPAMSILKHILRDDFIDEYNKQYLIAQLSKTGPPERSGNGWTEEYYEPKPAVFKIKEFPDLFEKEFQKEENFEKYKPQSISTLERNHIFYFTNPTGEIPDKDKVIGGWERPSDQGGGYKNKRKSRRKTRRKSKKKKEKRKRNTRKR